MADSLSLFGEASSPKKKAPAPSKAVDKAPDAYRTIGEAASELGVATHVLRFWETKFKQIKPIKRGGGRRYYRPVDMDVIRQIKTKLYDDGYTIKGVQTWLKENKQQVKETVEGNQAHKTLLQGLLKDLKSLRAALD